MNKLFTKLPITFNMKERADAIKAIRKDFVQKEIDIRSGYSIAINYQFNNVKAREEGVVVDIRGTVFNRKVMMLTKRKVLISFYLNSSNYAVTVLKMPKKEPRRKKLSYLYKPK